MTMAPLGIELQLTNPVTVSEMCGFLNKIRHRENNTSPVLVNSVNLDSPYYFDGKNWTPCNQTLANHPATLVTYRAALAYSEYHNIEMPNADELKPIAENPFKQNSVVWREINIEERFGGTIPVHLHAKAPHSDRHHILGNIAYWCASDENDEMGTVFGLGWNKSRFHFPENILTKRAKCLSSVSIGMRFAKESLSGC